MSMTGSDPEHPTKVGVPIGDLLAGLDVVDEGSSSNERRVAHPADLIDEIEDDFVAEDAESWLARPADAGVPAAWLDAVDQAQRADGSAP